MLNIYLVILIYSLLGVVYSCIKVLLFIIEKQVGNFVKVEKIMYDNLRTIALNLYMHIITINIMFLIYHLYTLEKRHAQVCEILLSIHADDSFS